MIQIETNNELLQEILDSINELPEENYKFFKDWITNPTTTPLVIPHGIETIGSSAFRNNYGLSSVVFPDTLKTIDIQAFMGCTNLAGHIDLKNVTKLNGAVFRGASKITSISMNKMEDIGDNAFRDLKLLTDIILPGTVNSIKAMAFYGCTKLKTVTFIEGDKSIPTGTMASNIFSECPALTDIYVYWSSTSIINAPWGAPVGCKIHYNDKIMKVSSDNSLVEIKE